MAHKPTLDDLKIAFPSLGKGLEQLLNFNGDVESTFLQHFIVTYEVFGASKTVELKSGGKDIPLTNANRQEYVQLYVEWALEKGIYKQYHAFENGFLGVCGGETLKLFRWEELELLICGSPNLDFEALEQATHYDDGFSEDTPVIKNFWSVVHEMSVEDKKKLLFFATGSDRVPIKGLGSLNFTISKAGPDSDTLPTSHTCFNQLILPEYATRDKVKRCVYMAIQHAQGFGLL